MREGWYGRKVKKVNLFTLSEGKGLVESEGIWNDRKEVRDFVNYRGVMEFLFDVLGNLSKFHGGTKPEVNKI